VSLTRNLLDLLTKQPKPSKKILEKLDWAFLIVSTFNALFGNPNIQVVQLHDDFRAGIKN
jgi:hypothetical protein